MPKFSECWRCGKNLTNVVCPRCQVAKYCSVKCQADDKVRHKVDCDAASTVKTCGACGKTATGLKTCSACFQAFYCDVHCQKKDRSRHKEHCKDTERRIKSLAERISTVYSVLCSSIPQLYYWGNSPAFDCLNLEENEGYDYKSRMNVLFYGVGDLRNVALTCASLPDTYETELKFTLNDIVPCTLARLVLLLYMLIKGESGIEKTVTEVWYSVLLSEQTYRSLTYFLRELVEMRGLEDLKVNTRGLVAVDENHLKELKFVWKTWLDLRVMKTTWIQEQRRQKFESDPGSSLGKMGYYNSIPSEHVKSAKKWMKDGVFSQAKLPLVAENPTLTGSPLTSKSVPFSYACPSDVLPFTGWDYLQVKKFSYCDSVITMYGSYIENVLKRFKHRLSANHVSIQAVLGNCMKIDHYLEPKQKYDRIITSNLLDYILFPRLLKLCSEKLNHGNPYATIVTEIHNWTDKFCGDADVVDTNLSHQFELINRALEDTHNHYLVMFGSGTSIREYNDNYDKFQEYLRASFYACYPQEESNAEKHHTLPSPKRLGNEFHLRLRDYRRNENRLVFFKLAVNCRRVTMISGVERTLEWVPMME